MLIIGMKKKRVGIILLVLIVMLVVVAGLVWYLFFRQPMSSSETKEPGVPEKIQLATVCSNDQIKLASSAIEPYNADVLRAVSTEIKGKSGHENDQNCMYILARYYIATGQLDLVAGAVNRIQALQTAGGRYSLLFKPPALNVSDLRETVRLQQSSQTSVKSTGYDLDDVDKEAP